MNKNQPLTRGISHGWVCADSTSRISSQHQFRSDNPEYSGPPRLHTTTVVCNPRTGEKTVEFFC